MSFVLSLAHSRKISRLLVTYGISTAAIGRFHIFSEALTMAQVFQAEEHLSISLEKHMMMGLEDTLGRQFSSEWTC